MGAARGGDRGAFDEVVRRTYLDTYTLARRLTADEHDARDVTQEVYLRVWRGLDGFRGDAAFTTWLYRVTANTASSSRRGLLRRRRRQVPLDDRHDPEDRAAADRPEAAVEAADGLARLAAALDLLSPKLRRVVVLKDVYALSHEVIATELGISVEAAKVRLHRGRRRLREVLEAGDGGHGAA